MGLSLLCSGLADASEVLNQNLMSGHLINSQRVSSLDSQERRTQEFMYFREEIIFRKRFQHKFSEIEIF